MCKELMIDGEDIDLGTEGKKMGLNNAGCTCCMNEKLDNIIDKETYETLGRIIHRKLIEKFEENQSETSIDGRDVDFPEIKITMEMY